MKNNMFIDPKYLIGQPFTGFDAKLEYTCIGYYQNENIIIVGAAVDPTNSTTQLKTFKLADVKFKNDITAVKQVI